MTFLVLDCGIFTALASALSDGGKHKVLYHTDWAADPFPKLQDFAPGTGFENLIKIKRLWTEIDFQAEDAPVYRKGNLKIDCVINFDVGRNDEIVKIKEDYPELSVVGSGAGEVLEEDREGLKKWCKTLSLDVQPYDVVIGIDALENYSKTHEDIFAKIDIFRQSMETLHIKDYNSAKNELLFEKLRVELGQVFSNTMKFIVEKAINSDVEIGFDGWHISGYGYTDKCFMGYEYKKGAYLTRVYDYEGDLPDIIKDTMEAFLPVLEHMDYRGYLSTEEKILKNGKHYLLDWCSRLLSPGSALYPYAIKNWAQFNYDIGRKEFAEADIEYKYYGALPLFSEEGKENYVWIKVDPKYKEYIRFLSVCSNGKECFSVKGKQSMAACVAGGNTWQEVIDKLKEYAEHVDFDGKDADEVKKLDNFADIIKQGKECGISF